jgi:transcriptional regulator with XRE-family HTH domain
MNTSSAPLSVRLKHLTKMQKLTQTELATRTLLTRLTVANTLNGGDAKLSTITALFDELGYYLLPVPKALQDEVSDYIENGGKLSSQPAGSGAPLSISQTILRDVMLKTRDNDLPKAKR